MHARRVFIRVATATEVVVGCQEDDVSGPSGAQQRQTETFAVCTPEEPLKRRRNCIRGEKSVEYFDVWKSEFMRRNGIDDEYFNDHISDVWTSSLCWNSGITFRVHYRFTIEWAVIDRTDKFVIMLPPAWLNDPPRRTFSSTGSICSILAGCYSATRDG